MKVKKHMSQAWFNLNTQLKTHMSNRGQIAFNRKA